MNPLDEMQLGWRSLVRWRRYLDSGASQWSPEQTVFFANGQLV
jgi:hypothetical protein